jgi:hypothetical protein
MKRIKLCFCSAILIMVLGVGIGEVACADSITPLSLLEGWEAYRASWQKGITRMESQLITWGFG